MILQHKSHDEDAPWEEEDPPSGAMESIGDGSQNSSNCQHHHGERRGSTGARRPMLVTESRDSLHSETAPQKPLREALKFDLTQPWQRSLLRDLEQIENTTAEDGEIRPRPHADRILLGHAESGDYMLECEDDISAATDTSSTCPTRLQVVHRHQFPMRPRDTSPTPDPAKFVDIRNTSPKGIHDEVSLSLQHAMPSAPDIPYLAYPVTEENSEGFRPIPHALPYGRTLSRAPVAAELYRSNAFSEEAKPAQASRVLAEDDYTEYDPACLCMGYSSLIDLLLFNEPSIRKKKRRTNFWESSPSASRRSSLGRVQEDDEDEDENFLDNGLNPFCMPQQNTTFFHPRDLELQEHHQY